MTEKINYSKTVDNILSDYEKAKKVIQSVKYTGQFQTALNYCNALIMKNGYLNKVHWYRNFLKRAKLFFTGELKDVKKAITFLDAVTRELDDLCTEANDSATHDPIEVGYGKNTISRIIKDTEEHIKKNDKDYF